MKRFPWLAFGFLGVALAGLVAVSLPTPEPIATVPDPVYAQGWIEDRAEVEAIRATLEIPDFKDTPAGRSIQGDPKFAYLWKAVEKATGKPAPIYNQGSVGSCVSFGTARAISKSLAVQINLGERFEWGSPVEEVIYAGSRVEIGGRQIRGDGSIGAWAARFVTTRGAPPRSKYTLGNNTYDLTSYSESRCRSWGNSGVPDDLEEESKKFQVGDASMVTTWAEAKKALSQGYGIAVCSNQGFSMRRDASGVAAPSGSWAHCMCLDGFYIDENTGKEYGHFENSWGANAHTGPVGWGEPPVSGFWAESSVVNKMLAQRDSWAFSATRGFPARKIDWFAHRWQPSVYSRVMATFFPSLKPE